MSAGTDYERRLDDAGKQLEGAVMVALRELELTGISPRNADEFIRECVFSAWMDWEYEPAVVVR